MEELLVPMGYEDAPPVVMITTTTRGHEEEEEGGEEGEGDDQEEEGEHVVRQFIKVRNDATWPVSITEVRDRAKGGGGGAENTGQSQRPRDAPRARQAGPELGPQA